MNAKGQSALSRDHYYAVPADEKNASFAVATSPIMSPEGTPSTAPGVSAPGTFAAEQRRQKLDDEERDEQVLRISTIAFSNDYNSNRSPDSDVKLLNGDRIEIVEDGFGSKPSMDRRRRPGRILAVLATMWRKRAKHFIPILLLILYSATGGALFWLLEGRGRATAAEQERLRREQQAEIERNITVSMLVSLTEALHAQHVSQRLATFDYSRIDTLVQNVSVFPDNTIQDGAFSSLVAEALNDTFVLEEPLIALLDTVLYNFSRTLPPPVTGSNTKDWSYWTSVFYAGTIYTTVGYGYITAVTDWGRGCTIAYALFGIPLVLYTLNQLGRFLVSGIWKCYCGAWRLWNWCLPLKYRSRRTKKVVAEFPFSVAVIITVIWMMMCSGLFCVLEDWPYFTSFYFFFQSLTTIGFGDVKPKHPEYLVGSFLLILIGLALVSMCWSLLQLKFDHLINMATQKITQQFVHTELEGGHMTTDAPSIKTEIEKIAAGENAWLAAFLDENRRRVLMDEWRHRAKMSNKYVQTEVTCTDQAIQNVAEIQDAFSQTPQYMSPEHQYRATEVPYREIRLGASGAGANAGQQVVNDECRAMLQGLRSIIGECRDTLSNKDLTTFGTSPVRTVMLPGRSSSANAAKKRAVSRASTTASMTMMEY